VSVCHTGEAEEGGREICDGGRGGEGGEGQDPYKGGGKGGKGHFGAWKFLSNLRNVTVLNYLAGQIKGEGAGLGGPGAGTRTEPLICGIRRRDTDWEIVGNEGGLCRGNQRGGRKNKWGLMAVVLRVYGLGEIHARGALPGKRSGH